MVNLGAALDVFHAELFWERYPKIQLLLHESLRVDAEAFKVYEEHFWIVADHYFFRCNLARQARLAHKFVILIQKLLEAEASHALDERRVGLDVQAEVEECFLAPRRCLTADTGDNVEELAHEELLHERCRCLLLRLAGCRLVLVVPVKILRRLKEVLVDLVEQPIDEFMRVMVLIIVEECIRRFEGENESFVVKCTTLFLIRLQVLKEQVQLVEHVFLILVTHAVLRLLGVLSFTIRISARGLVVEERLPQRQAVEEALDGRIGVANRRRWLSRQPAISYQLETEECLRYLRSRTLA